MTVETNGDRVEIQPEVSEAPEDVFGAPGADLGPPETGTRSPGPRDDTAPDTTKLSCEWPGQPTQPSTPSRRIDRDATRRANPGKWLERTPPGVANLRECYEECLEWQWRTPDGLPVIGEAGGVIFATGHGMLGVTLAPLTGRLVASLVDGSASHPALERLSPGRF